MCRVHGGFPELFGVHLTEALIALYADIVAHFVQAVALLLVRVGIAHVLALFVLEKRRLGDVDVAVLDQRAHEAEEEGQKQGADVRAVDVGIGHQDDLAVAQLFEVEVVAEARAKRGDHRGELFVTVDLVETRLFDVQHLAPQRQDGLIPAVTAFLGRAARRIALDDVDFGQRRVALLTVGQLAGQGSAVERRLAAGHFTRFACRLAGTRRGLRLVDDRARHRRIFLKEGGQAVVHHGLDQRAHVAVAELGLGLALELGFLQLDRDNRGQALAAVVARKRLIVFLDEVILAAVVVEHAGERGLESGFMGAALGGIDVVRKRDEGFRVRVGVLHGDLGHAAFAAALHVDDVLVDRGLGAVEVLDELADAALVMHDVLAHFLVALVAQGDLDARVQERLIAQALFKHVVFKFGGFEDLGVGLETDSRAGLAFKRHRFHLLDRHAALKAHSVLFVTVAYLGFHPHGQGVYDRRTDAVQAAGNLVAIAAEFAACMQHGQHDLEGRNAHLRMNAAGDAAAVVLHADDIALFDGHFDVGAVAGERLVDRIVDDLVHQMVQTLRRGGADVHARALADGLKTLQHLNLAFVVGFGHLEVEHFPAQPLVLFFDVFTHRLFLYLATHGCISSRIYRLFLHFAFLDALLQRAGGDLRNIEDFAQLAGAQHGRLGQVVAQVHDPAFLTQPFEQQAGASGRGGGVHIKDTDD